ncbi:MAG: hypothetical protein ACE5HP_05300 [Gemmatimonadota bacterium]
MRTASPGRVAELDRRGGAEAEELSQLIRHQIAGALLHALRQEGLGVRDLFEGRQEPLSWFFRALAFDQSELDIMESGAVEVLHAPSAVVELVVDELALACANVGVEGVASYLEWHPPTGEESGEPVEADGLAFDPSVVLGYLNVDVAPPSLWLEERESSPDSNERLANLLSEMAREIGSGSDAVEVHIEGALDPGGGWSEGQEHVRPAGISLHFTFDISLVEADERELARAFTRGAATAAQALERMRAVFRSE